MYIKQSYLSFRAGLERAKGESDPKKRKREDEEGQVNEQMDSNEGSAKKKKPLDTSAKLSAFAFNKE